MSPGFHGIRNIDNAGFSRITSPVAFVTIGPGETIGCGLHGRWRGGHRTGRSGAGAARGRRRGRCLRPGRFPMPLESEVDSCVGRVMARHGRRDLSSGLDETVGRPLSPGDGGRREAPYQSGPRTRSTERSTRSERNAACLPCATLYSTPCAGKAAGCPETSAVRRGRRDGRDDERGRGVSGLRTAAR